MLFDLRSRRRRNVVRVIYVLLALVMVAGLLLVGVGTGSNNGGILNALGGSNNGGSSSGRNTFVQKQVKKYEAAVKANPTSKTALAQLFQARWELAESNANFKPGNLTAAEKQQVKSTVATWQKYLKVTGDKPSLSNAETAGRAYQYVPDYSGAASAWEYAIQQAPAGAKSELSTPYLCLALDSYASGAATQGDAASTRVLKLLPKLDRSQYQSVFKKARKTPATAKEYATDECY